MTTQPIPTLSETTTRLLTARAFCRDNDRRENAASRKMGAITAQQQSMAGSAGNIGYCDTFSQSQIYLSLIDDSQDCKLPGCIW